MSVDLVLFYAFAAVLLVSAVGVITVRNPVHAALLLVLTFFSSALTWILIRAEFLGIALILVYVGAVMVLFLFVVMMLDINVAKVREGFARYLPVGAFVAVIMAVQLLALVGVDQFGPERFPLPGDPGPGYSNTEEVGKLLFTQYLVPFEIAGVILLVGTIAAVALTHRRRTGVRTQNPALQAAVRKADRLRIVRMPAEKSDPGESA